MQAAQFEQLKEIANGEKRPENTELVTALGCACFTPDTTLGQPEIALLDEILHRLVRDVEMPVRRALAEQLSERDDAPHDLICLLADDVIDVAYTLLQKSPMLSDEDLVSVVTRHARQHALAISRRETLSEEVSAALVQTGDSNVVVSLLQNESANISGNTMEGLVAESESVAAYRAPLLGRKDLNLDIAMRMADWVGDSLRQYIAERFDIDQKKLDRAVSDAVLEAIDGDIFENKTNPRYSRRGARPKTASRADARQSDLVQTDFRGFVRHRFGLGGRLALQFGRSLGDRGTCYRARPKRIRANSVPSPQHGHIR